jgi:hypothetical protein
LMNDPSRSRPPNSQSDILPNNNGSQTPPHPKIGAFV